MVDIIYKNKNSPNPFCSKSFIQEHSLVLNYFNIQSAEPRLGGRRPVALVYQPSTRGFWPETSSPVFMKRVNGDFFFFPFQIHEDELLMASPWK